MSASIAMPSGISIPKLKLLFFGLRTNEANYFKIFLLKTFGETLQNFPLSNSDNRTIVSATFKVGRGRERKERERDKERHL